MSADTLYMIKELTETIEKLKLEIDQLKSSLSAAKDRISVLENPRIGQFDPKYYQEELPKLIKRP